MGALMPVQDEGISGKVYPARLVTTPVQMSRGGGVDWKRDPNYVTSEGIKFQ